METTMNIFQTYVSSGLSVIPVKNKVCTLSGWKQYQNKLPSMEEAAEWSGDVAIICGAVSGGVVCIDFDVKNGDMFDSWVMAVTEAKYQLLSDLVYEHTPSGGYHVVFRSPKIIKNLKLACNKGGAATIETRGEGGYFVCAPSAGYSMKYGIFEDIRTISAEETELLLSIAASFNEKIIESIPPIPAETSQTSGNTPFNDFDSKCDITALLAPHGWKNVFNRGQVQYYQRPNKPGGGISASWNSIPGRFYVFSTSTVFEHEHVYKPSAVYAILEHGGDFSAAAKALYAKGYGDRMETSVIMPKERKTCVIDSANIRTKLMDIYNDGYIKGNSTGWSNLDCFYSVIKGQFTVVTGMPSHGKSEFVDALLMNLAKKQNWRFAVFAPENYPVEMHYHKLIEKYICKPFTHGEGRMSVEEMDAAIDFIDEHFYFIDATEDEINLDSVLSEAQQLITNKQIDGLVLDPFNEIELDRPKDQSATEYIGKCLRISRKFARRNNIHLWIVAHPTKMQKDRDGNYPVPELYDIEGSAHWRNKADNGICVHRDFLNDTTAIHIQKIKYRYCGRPGTIHLKYDVQSGGYYEIPEPKSGRYEF